ncbi:hypothetical protein [Neisseria sp. Ec49-e6-T10]|uniref:hypothetical protein n=1 Tax=Neisseria sp. Ec49-e6-T10 TaxID=3140744 RepID=UPI003EBA2103
MQEKPIEVALQLALDAHKGQVDKGGQAYILHPLRLMMRFSDETMQIISLLHDVVEDSDITLEQIAQLGFDQTIIDALNVLTKKEQEPYEQFIQRVSTNRLAIQVKIADLKDNLNIARIPHELTQKDLLRLNKYHCALMYLLSL